MTFNGPINWETLVIKPCRKVQVKDLRMGDVIENSVWRGFVEKVSSDKYVGVQWYDKLNNPTSYYNYSSDEIIDVEVVGHIDLWNL